MRSFLHFRRALALAVPLLAWPPAPASAQNGRAEVASVRFEGNQTFPSDSLAVAIVTRQSECRLGVLIPFCWFGADFATERWYLRRRDIPMDQFRLLVWYYRRGFREAEVDTATAVLDDGRAEVRFTVREGRPVRVDSIGFHGAEDFEGTGLLDGLPLRVGERLSMPVVDATRDTLTRRLQNRGYARAEVLRTVFVPRNEYVADVDFDIAPGTRARYGHISVRGAEELSEATVLRTLQFRNGDIFRRDQLTQAQSRLFGLEIIRAATVEPRFEEGSDSVIPVDVTVQEGDAYRMRFGAGWTTAECFDTEARWASRNFFGGGRILQVRARLSNVFAPNFRDLLCPQSGTGEFDDLTWLSSIDFAQPWIFSTRNSFNASLFAERQSLPDVFVRQAVGVQVALRRWIGPQTPLTLSYRPELSRLDAAEVLFCTGLLVCALEDITLLSGANWLAPVGINFARNLSNNPLNPSRGYTLVLDIEHAAGWTGSNFRYDRVVAEGTHYNELGTTGVLAARLRAGFVGSGGFDELGRTSGAADIVHPQKRFYAGGANSVRGFAQSRLGPRVLTVDRPETLLAPGADGAPPPCTPDELIDLTCDAGALDEGRLIPRPAGGTRVLEGNLEARARIGRRFETVLFTDVGQVWAPGERVDLGDLQVTPGVGVRFLSPVGPIRVDLAYRFRGGEALTAVTPQIRPFDATRDELRDRLEPVPGQPIQYVRSGELAVLATPIFYGDSPAASLSRLQLHISIGQAF